MKSIINLKRDMTNIEKPQKIKEEAAQNHTEHVHCAEIQQFENKEIKEQFINYEVIFHCFAF